MGAKLPILQSDSAALGLMQTKWASVLEPVLANSLVNGRLLKNVSLSTGANVINHGLGRPLQGWVLTRLRAAESIYDTQDSNPYPALTLLLVSTGDVVVDLYVF